MTDLLGVDVAWTKPAAADLKAAGYAFAIGYLSYDSTKNLTPAFVADCHAHGLGVGLVFEADAQRAAQGHSAGAQDALAAAQQAAKLGAPGTTTIYVAVDFDAEPAQVMAYFAAWRQCRYPFGPYGSKRIVEALKAAGLAAHCWQTVAWSGGQVSPAADLYQREAHTRPAIQGVATDSYDEDIQLTADAGLWLPAAAPTPAPTPVQEDDMPRIFKASDQKKSPGVVFADGALLHHIRGNPSPFQAIPGTTVVVVDPVDMDGITAAADAQATR